MLIELDRDSVAAGDDVELHREQRMVDARLPLERLVSDLVRGYLPSIEGGRSCWILRKSRNGEPLGVLRIRSTRFDGLRLLGGVDLDVSEIGDSLYFQYAAQADPDDVFARL